MTEKLNRSAREGSVDALYSILAEHDDDSIADTPLHIAASVGNTHYAMEIATLKPPLARQLNRQGLSPMHVALQNRHKQVVRALLAIDRELVRVKGKGRITPLHYVAEMEDLDLLAEFLSACPSSIEDLTVQCETAVHVAVKNKRLAVVEVLIGWLIRVNKKEVLQWKDEDGNTVLHIATSTKQPKVML
ncbi:ankyrin repeat-containing protein BDA1-like [Pistacia vera]|uniref:ankyrin repeat-containing protein BDA1-like n=1 Tax=Pistacia vera TaxID=55513 RepID=UPI0012634DBB|nr:ankyrin repeat-containing protein BDA1-like [Pistacia vera]